MPTELATFAQASKSIYWTKAMQQEYDALLKNKSWNLVPAPPNANIIDCKWVYKLKHNLDCPIARYKARLVAKGFSQTHGLDYFETFSPIVKVSTIIIAFALSISYNQTIRQLDVQNALLNGDLQEQVFMSQLPGFTNTRFPTHICKLKKAIYGLNQAPRAWYTKLSHALLGWGF